MAISRFIIRIWFRGSALAAGVAGAEGAVETLFDEVTQSVADAFGRDGVDDVDHEGLHQHGACFGQWYAAGLHVEQRFVVELSGCGAVGAFYVVVVDEQLRFGVHARFF